MPVRSSGHRLQRGTSLRELSWGEVYRAGRGDEAATVDGASYWKIFYSVIIPLSLPGISAIMFFAFIAAWNDLLYILVLAQGQSMMTTQVFLYSMVGQYSTSWGLLLSASVMSTAPAVVLYFAVQKFLISGILAGSVKG